MNDYDNDVFLCVWLRVDLSNFMISVSIVMRFAEFSLFMDFFCWFSCFLQIPVFLESVMFSTDFRVSTDLHDSPWIVVTLCLSMNFCLSMSSPWIFMSFHKFMIFHEFSCFLKVSVILMISLHVHNFPWHPFISTISYNFLWSFVFVFIENWATANSRYSMWEDCYASYNGSNFNKNSIHLDSKFSISTHRNGCSFSI